MIVNCTRLLIAAMLASAVAGCNGEPNGSASQDDSPATSAAPAAEIAAAPVPEAPAPLPPATELPVDKLQSVMVSRPADALSSVIIRASGSVVSSGWTGAKLAPVEDPNADARVRIFSFLATSPETPGEARAPQTVETEIRVDDVPPEVRTIRVISATNAISAPVVQ